MINRIRWGIPKRKQAWTEDPSTRGLSLLNMIISTVQRVFRQRGDSADVSMKSWSKVACLCINVNQRWSIISLPTKMSPWGDAILLQAQYSCVGLCTPRSKAVINTMAVWLHGMSDPWNIREWTVTLAWGFVAQSPLGLSMLTTRSSVSVAPLPPDGCWFINIWNDTRIARSYQSSEVKPWVTIIYTNVFQCQIKNNGSNVLRKVKTKLFWKNIVSCYYENAKTLQE